jgi:hypothetical protein
LVQYLCAKGTADDQIWPLVNGKLDVLSKAGLTKENLADAKCSDDLTKKSPSIVDEFNKLMEEETKNNPVDIITPTTALTVQPVKKVLKQSKSDLTSTSTLKPKVSNDDDDILLLKSINEETKTLKTINQNIFKSKSDLTSNSTTKSTTVTQKTQKPKVSTNDDDILLLKSINEIETDSKTSKASLKHKKADNTIDAFSSLTTKSNSLNIKEDDDGEDDDLLLASIDLSQFENPNKKIKSL